MGDRSLEDEDFDYGGHADGGEEDQEGFGHDAMLVTNQPHDEEVALSESNSFAHPPDSPSGAGHAGGRGGHGGGGAYDTSLIDSQDDDGPGGGYPAAPQSYDHQSLEPQAGKPRALETMAGAPSSDALFPTSGTGAGGGDEGGDIGGYNSLEYKHLNVSDEIRDLFKYIGRYSAHTIELDTQLKPFVPDYIPCVGGIDEFIKVPRPDGKPDFLGLKVLDEPASRQSDPAVLTLQLRQNTKEATSSKAEMVGRVEHGDENKAKKITQWIGSIAAIHKTKPAANISYSRRMPDIEALMQEWPPEMEAFMKNMKMPSGELDLDLKAYVKMLCGLMDIPVYDNPIESLHVLFSLYLEFKSNPIFKQQLDMDRGYDTGALSSLAGEEAHSSHWMSGARGGSGGQDANGANVFAFN